MTPAPTVTLDIDQNPCLPRGGTEMTAVLTVTVSGTAALDAPAAEVIIVDTSGSMTGRKIVAAHQAARAAVDTLRDGTLFAVIAGTSTADQIYPAHGLATASARTRESARLALRTLRAGGGTALGSWLRLAADLLAPHREAVRHAIMLTDGQGPLTPADLEYCTGVFACDALGIGEDWDYRVLDRVADTLLGNYTDLRDTEDLEAHFRALAEKTMAKAIPELALRIRTPGSVQVAALVQAYPDQLDLTAMRAAVDPRTGDYPTAAWGEEQREFVLRLTGAAEEPGEEARWAKVGVLNPAATEELGEGKVMVRWTDDPAASTRVSPKVGHYTGQMEQNALVREGMDAYRSGDEATARHKLGRARRLAEASGRTEIVATLDEWVAVDPVTGTVRLKGELSRATELRLGAGTRETRRAAGTPAEDAR